MPCSDAEKLALKAFLGQKRGMRKLISNTVVALVDYFAAKNTPVTELPTMRPPSTREQEQWAAEWMEYSKAARRGRSQCGHLHLEGL